VGQEDAVAIIRLTGLQ